MLCYGAMASVESATSSFLKDFSVLPAPSQVFGYDKIVQGILRKSLLLQGGSRLEKGQSSEAARWSKLLGVRACRGK